jgi:GNAT superfamily N-acetyltransferase
MRECLNAGTERGRVALAEVMARSYVAEIESVPADWARAMLVDGEPVSFIVVDPDRAMDQPGGDIPYAFIRDVATRKDRRREGHFRVLLEHTFSSLRVDGIPIVITHGRHQLYRPFGFDVFTYHSGIFITPEQVERAIGPADRGLNEQLLEVADLAYVREDLLLVTDVKATTLWESKAALQTAASLARERGKKRILFEHPSAPSYGSRYPIHAALETPFTTLARTCGAQVCVQGADPESGSIPDADWVKVLDPAVLLREALRGSDGPFPEMTACFNTNAGAVTIESRSEGLTVHRGLKADGIHIVWPSSALAQLVTGYRSAEVLDLIHGTSLPGEARAFLNGLFPTRWRFSRSESWTFTS